MTGFVMMGSNGPGRGGENHKSIVRSLGEVDWDLFSLYLSSTLITTGELNGDKSILLRMSLGKPCVSGAAADRRARHS